MNIREIIVLLNIQIDPRHKLRNRLFDPPRKRAIETQIHKHSALHVEFQSLDPLELDLELNTGNPHHRLHIDVILHVILKGCSVGAANVAESEQEGCKVT